MEHTKGGATADVSAQNAGSEPKTLAAGQPAEQAAGQPAEQLAGQPSLLEVACARPLSADEVAREQQQYAAQFVQLDREAWYTLGAALITTVIFWGAIALTHDSLITVGYLPLWFALSCLGGYVFSVVIVVALVKWCLKPCRLKVASYQELHRAED
ncbi:MAG: YhdT family protein [Anaerobiospirillum sp.]|nr:YhdT family protein [Anaerobiospirillum sp.]